MIRNIRSVNTTNPNVEELITDLRSTLVTKRIKAIKELGKLKSKESLEPLTATLNDRSKEVKCATIESLELINPLNLPLLLRPLIQDKSADVRLRVAHALSVSDSSLGVELLMILVKDKKDEVANMAAKSLAKHPYYSLPLLIKLFADESWKIRARAGMSISKIGKAAATALKVSTNDADANIRFWSITCLGHFRDKTYSNIFLNKLHDKDPGVRIASLRALRELGDPKVAAQLFEALTQPSDQVRDLIYEILRDFGSHSIPYLMDSLSGEYWAGRSIAAQTLTDMGSEAVEPLVKALKSQDKERRYWAIKVLGKMKEKTAYSAVKQFLSDEDPEIRMAALESMGYYLEPESIPLMIEKFTDPVWVVRKHASKSIIKFGNQAAPYLIRTLQSEAEDAKYWSLRTLGELKPTGLFPQLSRLFKDPSWTIRKTASDIFAIYGEEALIELTALSVDNDDPETKYWVLRSLGKIKSKMSLPTLFRSLDDDAEAIRDAAQKALSNYGSEVIDDLFALFKSDKRRLLESVCITLQRMEPPVVVPKLCRSLGLFDEEVSFWVRRTLCGFKNESHRNVLELIKSESDETRRQAAICLGQFGFKEDASAIIPLMKDESWPVRIAAAEALGQLGEPAAVSSLSEALEDEDEDLAMAAMISLGKIGDERAIPGLISILQHESWSLKYQAIRILGEMRVTRAFVDLIKLLDEDTLDLKPHIIHALSRINHLKCYDELKKRFETEKDSEARLAYIDGFAEIGNLAIVPVLIRLARQDNPSWEERRAAIHALGKIKSSDAKPVLLEFLKEKDAIISREAMAALEQILPKEEFEKTEKAITDAKKRQETFTISFNTGMKFLRSGVMGEAEKYLKEAVKINSKASYVYSALGSLYYNTGKLIDSTKAYLMAINLSPNDITLKLNLGMVYFRRRAYKESLQMFEKVKEAADDKSQQSIYATSMIKKIEAEIKKNR